MLVPMFTGIVQEIGIVDFFEKGSLTIKPSKTFLKGLKTGASCSIDGVCLTVVKIHEGCIFFDLLDETLAKTTLKSACKNRPVNCERSLKWGHEVGGHVLSGHVDGEIILEKKEKNILTFKTTPNMMKYLFPKGYVAIDGVSLTIVAIDFDNFFFTVHLIPETQKRTILGFKEMFASSNIEFDSQTKVIVDTLERQKYGCIK